MASLGTDIVSNLSDTSVLDHGRSTSPVKRFEASKEIKTCDASEACEVIEDGEDSSSSGASEDLDSRIEHAPRMLKKVSAYLQLMEERMQFLERQIRSLEGSERDQTAPSRRKARHKAKALATTVHRVQGLHFDSMDKNNVIDVFYEPLDSMNADWNKSELSQEHLEGRMPGRIRINSPVILKMLEAIASPHFDSRRPVIQRPFKVLCIHQDRIREYLHELDDEDPDDRAHFQCLIEVLDSDLSILQSIRKGEIEEISFHDLWHLFQPGDIIFNNASNNDKEAHMVMSAGVQDSADKKSSHFVVDCFRFDYDGQGFGPVLTSIELPAYEGRREIQSLPVLPSQFLAGACDTRKHLEERGRLFVKVARPRGVSHMYYSGATLDRFKIELDGHVIIDFEAAYQTLQHELPTLGVEVNLDYHSATSDNFIHCNSKSCIICKYLDRDNVYDLQRRNAMMSQFKPPLTQKLQENDLSELHYILLPYRVYGFALRTRKWCSLHLNFLAHIMASSDGFENLVLPVGYKSIIMSMVNMHSRPSSGSRAGIGGGDSDEHSLEIDLIKGKSQGQGLIMLLHGAPGVGKTSTAECVAAATGRPLMYLTAADLGLTSVEMEVNLEMTFSLAHKWGCILLLTEVDIFLQRRTGLEMGRNAMVSTFLKSLEYFSGILFMTTDRVGALDEGCKSRIHMSLYYPALDERSSLKIWNMNLRRIQMGNCDLKVRSRHIKAYARQAWKSGLRWNGRQIRNAFQTAVALAEHDAATGNVSKDGSDSSDSDDDDDEKTQGSRPSRRKVLTAAHFKQVVAASKAFDQYLSAVYGGEDSFSNYEGIRKDDLRTGTRGRKDYKAKNKILSSSSSLLSSDSEVSDSDIRTKKYKKQAPANTAADASQMEGNVSKKASAEAVPQLTTDVDKIAPPEMQSILDQLYKLMASNSQQLLPQGLRESSTTSRTVDSSNVSKLGRSQEKKVTKEDSSD